WWVFSPSGRWPPPCFLPLGRDPLRAVRARRPPPRLSREVASLASPWLRAGFNHRVRGAVLALGDHPEESCAAIRSARKALTLVLEGAPASESILWLHPLAASCSVLQRTAAL